MHLPTVIFIIIYYIISKLICLGTMARRRLKMMMDLSVINNNNNNVKNEHNVHNLADIISSATIVFNIIIFYCYNLKCCFIFLNFNSFFLCCYF